MTAETDQYGGVISRTIVRTISSTDIFTSTSQAPVPTPPQANDENELDSRKNSANSGAIAGGIIGGVVALAIVAIVIWLMRKRLRRERDSKHLDDIFRDPSSVGWKGDETDFGSGAAFASKGLGRRKSSTILDLEKKSRNDQEHWAALTSAEDEQDAKDIRSCTSPSSRQSLRALSAAMSSYSTAERSHGSETSETPQSHEKNSPRSNQDLSLSTESPRSSTSSPQKERTLPESVDSLKQIGTAEYAIEKQAPTRTASFHSGQQGLQQAPTERQYSSLLGDFSAQHARKPRSMSTSAYVIPEYPQGAVEPLRPGRRSVSPIYMYNQQAGSPTSPTFSSTLTQAMGLQNHRGSQPVTPYALPSPTFTAHRTSTIRSFNGDYPPSQYSHLDVHLKQDDGEGHVQGSLNENRGTQTRHWSFSGNQAKSHWEHWEAQAKIPEDNVLSVRNADPHDTSQIEVTGRAEEKSTLTPGNLK